MQRREFSIRSQFPAIAHLAKLSVSGQFNDKSLCVFARSLFFSARKDAKAQRREFNQRFPRAISEIKSQTGSRKNQDRLPV
jgi:hypothetical protein